LDSLVADCQRALSLARFVLNQYPAESIETQAIVQATELLSKLLAQDVRRSETGKAELIDGVAEDRIVSVHDPEMRHGHKSVSQRFDGYKASLAVETGSQVIAAVDVLPGNAHDNTNASSLVAESAKNLECSVEGVIGDGAYGTAEARLDAQANQYRLTAPVAQPAQKGRFTKDDFTIDLDRQILTCPAGQTTTTWYPRTTRTKRGTVFQHKSFTFSVKQCRNCPIRSHCLQSTTRQRVVLVHQCEALLQQARVYQRTDEYRAVYRQRVVVEHRIARLVRLGIRKARYFGSIKVLFQLAMAAAVANLTLFASSTTSMASVLLLVLLMSVLTILTLSRMTYAALRHPVQRDSRLVRI
jgi:IS5 family transposase